MPTPASGSSANASSEPEPEPLAADDDVVVALELPPPPAAADAVGSDGSNLWAALGLRMRFPYLEAVLPDGPAAAAAVAAGQPELRPGLRLTGVLRDGAEEGWTEGVDLLPEADALRLIAPAAGDEPSRLTLRFAADDDSGGFALLQRLTGAGFTVSTDDGNDGSGGDGEAAVPQGPRTPAGRVVRALPAAALLLGLAVGVADACDGSGSGSFAGSLLSMRNDKTYDGGRCVASAGALLLVLASVLLLCAMLGGGTYMLVALADYPPQRAKSRWAVALTEAAVGAVLAASHSQMQSLFLLVWVFAAPGGAALGRLVRCAWPEASSAWTGGYPSCAAVVAALWLLWAGAAADSVLTGTGSMADRLLDGLIAPGLFALLAGVGAYFAVELGNGCACCHRRCCCCFARCCGGHDADAEQADGHAGDGPAPPARRQRLARPLTALGAVLGLLLGILLGYLHEVQVTYGSERSDSAFFFAVLFFGVPGILTGAAGAQFFVDLYDVDGTADRSRWLDFALVLLSFGRRGRSAAGNPRAKIFALGCSVADCHSMMCGRLARLRAFRWLFGSTDRFSFWAQAVRCRCLSLLALILYRRLTMLYLNLTCSLTNSIHSRLIAVPALDA